MLSLVFGILKTKRKIKMNSVFWARSITILYKAVNLQCKIGAELDWIGHSLSTSKSSNITEINMYLKDKRIFMTSNILELTFED